MHQNMGKYPGVGKQSLGNALQTRNTVNQNEDCVGAICRFCDDENGTSEYILRTCGRSNAFQEKILGYKSIANQGILTVDSERYLKICQGEGHYKDTVCNLREVQQIL